MVTVLIVFALDHALCLRYLFAFLISPFESLPYRLFLCKGKIVHRLRLIVAKRTHFGGKKLAIFATLFHIGDNLRAKFFVCFRRILLVEYAVLCLSQTNASKEIRTIPTTRDVFGISDRATIKGKHYFRQIPSSTEHLVIELHVLSHGSNIHRIFDGSIDNTLRVGAILCTICKKTHPQVSRIKNIIPRYVFILKAMHIFDRILEPCLHRLFFCAFKIPEQLVQFFLIPLFRILLIINAVALVAQSRTAEA